MNTPKDIVDELRNAADKIEQSMIRTKKTMTIAEALTQLKLICGETTAVSISFDIDSFPNRNVVRWSIFDSHTFFRTSTLEDAVQAVRAAYRHQSQTAVEDTQVALGEVA